MAYNPSSYETVYGFDALDTVHNYFPEIMYDDGIFNNEILHWMRYRLQTLFPQVYPRQQNMYRIYSSQARQEMFRTFQNSRNIIQPPSISNNHDMFVRNDTRIAWPATSVRMPVTTPILVPVQRAPYSASVPVSAANFIPDSAPAPTSAPARIVELSVSPISSTQETPVLHTSVPSLAVPNASVLPAMSTVQTRSSILQPASSRGIPLLSVNDPLEDLLSALLSTGSQGRQSDSALLTSMLGGLGSLGNLGVWTTARNELLSDVLVIPTHAQVDSGSEIVHLEDVPEEVSCAICQERGTDESWRHLYCEHYFHRACVDRWFSRNVHCPVCRADIRTPNSE